MSDLNSSDDSSGSDFNIEKSPKYNILTRPKRRINSEKVSNIDHTFLSSSESEDEDFVPGSDEINDDINNFSDESIDSEQETENENKNCDGIKNEETDKECSIILENPCKISNRNSNAVRDSSLPVKRGPYKKVKDGIKTTKKERNVKTTATKSNVTKTKKRKYKKHQVFGNPMSDEETKKFISNFKNSKIKMEKKTKSKKIKKTCINNEDSTMTYKTAGTSNTGPCVKCHIHTTDSTSFPIYGVYQSHSETSESVVQRVGFTRERIPPIINQKSPWTCVFCHNRSEFINGIGCLFGPYRLSTDPDEEDITVEYKSSNQDKPESEADFKEVWLHEGCVVWTPNIYFESNRIKGISGVLESSAHLKCSSCKKPGATLMCNKHGCKKIFHFPCALQAESFFNTENFTINCKKHSTHQAASSGV